MSNSRKQPRNESSISYLITLTVNVRGVQIKAFVDLGSNNNYILGEAALRAGLQPQLKQTPYSLQVANRQRIPRESIIKHEVSTKLHIQGHQETICLDVFSLAAHNIILGIP
jgi:hypothetical protein